MEWEGAINWAPGYAHASELEFTFRQGTTPPKVGYTADQQLKPMPGGEKALGCVNYVTTTTITMTFLSTSSSLRCCKP